MLNPRSKGAAQWDLSEQCVYKDGKFGYRVVMVKSFAEPSDATLVLPPFPASSYSAVRLSFFARAMLKPTSDSRNDDGQSSTSPRMKLVFAVANSPPPSGSTGVSLGGAPKLPPAAARDAPAIDAWVVRLATIGWKRHVMRLEIPPHLRRASISTKLLLGGSAGTAPGMTYCFDDFELMPASEIASPPAPPPPPPLVGLVWSIDFEEDSYRTDDGAFRASVITPARLPPRAFTRGNTGIARRVISAFSLHEQAFTRMQPPPLLCIPPQYT